MFHALNVFLQLARRLARACLVRLELDDYVPDDNVAAPEADDFSHEVDGRHDLRSMRDALAVQGGDHGPVVHTLAVALAEGLDYPVCVSAKGLHRALFPCFFLFWLAHDGVATGVAGHQ